MAAPQSNLPAQFASASLYVGDLLPDVTEALLFELFNAVGPVASVRVCRDAQTRRSLGYAYVNYHQSPDAERAIDTMNFTEIMGQPCRIMWSHRDPSLRRSGAGNVFVKNLHPSIDNKTLFDTFSIFGSILSCKVCRDKEGKSLGYGFVHFENETEAAVALDKVQGMEIAGNKVSVAPFKSKRERHAGDSKVFTNVYAKGFAEDFTKEGLDQLFGQFGEITSSKLVMKQDDQKKCAGFGFVNFAKPDAAAAAVEKLNGFELPGSADESKDAAAADAGDKKAKKDDAATGDDAEAIGDESKDDADKKKEPRRLFVGRAQKKTEREAALRKKFEQARLERAKKWEGVNVYIKNLTEEVDEDALRAEFSEFGAISSVRVMRDQNTKKSRGFGFVCFTKSEEAQKAVLQKNNKMFKGKPLYVALAQRKEVRRAQLEAQHQARIKMGVPQPGPVYPGPQGAMFYPGAPQGMPQRMVYPAQMMPGRPWGNQGRTPNSRPMMPNAQMGFMPNAAAAAAAGGAMPMNGRGAPRNNRGRQQKQGKGRGKGGNNQQQQQPQGQPQQPFYNQVAQPMVQQPQQVQQVQQQQVQQQQAPQQPAAQQLTVAMLAQAPPEQAKQMIGERLFPRIQESQPQQAAKITGMLLEMDNGELLNLLESPAALQDKIQEALTVLREHEAAQQ